GACIETRPSNAWRCPRFWDRLHRHGKGTKTCNLEVFTPSVFRRSMQIQEKFGLSLVGCSRSSRRRVHLAAEIIQRREKTHRKVHAAHLPAAAVDWPRGVHLPRTDGDEAAHTHSVVNPFDLDLDRPVGDEN